MSTRPHWLATKGRSTSPKVVVSFDTETVSGTRDGNEVLTLRCWDTAVRQRNPDLPGDDRVTHWAGETAAELADILTAAVALTGEAWAFAHNAGFDLTVTSLPMVLAGRGWEPEFVNLGDETCVFVMKGANGRLVITDSWSWLRCSLEVASKDVGMRKVTLPDSDDSLAAWHHRCHHDVMILDRLLAQLLDWWDASDLGRFAVTGASCGWRTLRAKVPPRSVLVGPEPPRTGMERQAIFGGRKEVWQVGRIRGGWVEDWDLVKAHGTVMATMPMPATPVRNNRLIPPPSPVAPPDGFGALCEVQITTTVPCAPVRVSGDVWWPVGTFRTWLTTPELAEVVKDADRVTILQAHWYRLDMSMAQWGRWCLDLQAHPDTEVPRVVKRVAKNWGRAVPGRFAMQTSELISERDATHLGWAIEAGFDLDTGAALEIVTYGGVERTYRKDQDGVDVSPIVLAFVEGYVRAAMAATLRQRDPARLLQCNTDGWWELRHPRAQETPDEVVPAPFRVDRKAVSRDVTILGPNHTDSKGDRRLAGIPRDATQRLDGSFTWQDWPGLRWQMQFSRPGEFLRPRRELLLQRHYCRRWVLTSGETVPVDAAVDRQGRTVLLPWSQASQRRPDDRLAEHQVQALQPLADADAAWVSPAGAAGSPQPGRR